MSSSVLSLIGIKSKQTPVPAVERPQVRTIEPTDRNAGDVNILGIAAVHSPIRISAVEKKIAEYEEKLADAREELIYLQKLQQIAAEYQSLRETRQRERKSRPVNTFELGI